MKRAAARIKLPPIPADVTELKFTEFFAPIGDRGLEYSEKLKSLEGKRVRILGYMIQSETPAPGILMLSPVPMTLHETEYGHGDDLPVTIAHVFVPKNRDKAVPFTPGQLLLTGKLETGPREEADGRISTVRLLLDPPNKSARAKKLSSTKSPNNRTASPKTAANNASR